MQTQEKTYADTKYEKRNKKLTTAIKEHEERIMKNREEFHEQNLEAIGLETDLLLTYEDKLKKIQIWGSALAHKGRHYLIITKKKNNVVFSQCKHKRRLIGTKDEGKKQKTTWFGKVIIDLWVLNLVFQPTQTPETLKLMI